MTTLKCGVLFHVAFALADYGGDTSVTQALNKQIARGHAGVYTGGRGVLVRNPFDGFSDDKTKQVVPGTLWVNDIFAVSQLYPSGDPRKPMNDGVDDDCWARANMAFVVGSAMPKLMPDWENIQDPHWGWGVFYPYDSNSVDQRCRWLPDKKMYDCPGGIIPWGGQFQSRNDAYGSGGFPFGNPHVNSNNGGGSGCHWNGYWHDYKINQFPGNDGKNTLLQNEHCECKYTYKGEPWDPTENKWVNWVDQFHTVAMGGNKVYSDFQDLAACWVNNPRDMINLQNALYWARNVWNDQLSPKADYVNFDDYVHWRRYWGWNEVPVSREVVQDAKNWDAVVIYLPAGVDRSGLDTPYDMDDGAQAALSTSIDGWVSAGYLKVGSQYIGTRPGSYVVFARQTIDASGNYATSFFCQSWQHSGSKYKVVWATMSKDNPTGACWVDWNKGALESPTNHTEARKSTSSGDAEHKHVEKKTAGEVVV